MAHGSLRAFHGALLYLGVRHPRKGKRVSARAARTDVQVDSTRECVLHRASTKTQGCAGSAPAWSRGGKGHHRLDKLQQALGMSGRACHRAAREWWPACCSPWDSGLPARGSRASALPSR
eukprot:1396345-Prymnesium_polylepis.3